MRRKTGVIFVVLIITIVFGICTSFVLARDKSDNIETLTPTPLVIETVSADVVEPDINLSDDEIELIALTTIAEAEGECELGKRMVIDVILNRILSEHFPDSAYETIYQPNQFSSMWNGRVDRCTVTDDVRRLVIEEATNRTNTYVIFFNAEDFSEYGEPMFQIENHYFSSYE